jgi:hypothetical protein
MTEAVESLAALRAVAARNKDQSFWAELALKLATQSLARAQEVLAKTADQGGDQEALLALVAEFEETLQQVTVRKVVYDEQLKVVSELTDTLAKLQQTTPGTP